MNSKWLLILGVLAFVACGPKEESKKTTASQDGNDNVQVAQADKTKPVENAKPAEVMESDTAQVEEITEIDPAELLTSLEERYDTAMAEFRTAYQEAPEEERRQIAADKYPKPDEYASEFMQLAKDHPDHAAAVSSLMWVAQRVRGGQADEAIDLLFEKHSDSPEMSQLCFSLMYGGPSGKSQQRLEKLASDSPHHDVQGIATFCLATFLQRGSGKNADDESSDDESSEYVALFKKVVDEYGDVNFRDRSIAKMASGAIFEIENLSIGKVAPDIEAEDLDGVSFKLSDYRGKVLMLDFWGDW